MKLFISHSAHSKTDQEFMFSLEDRLQKAGYQVCLDRSRLTGDKAGERWRNELYQAICCCHGAIILITREALKNKHPWVFKEYSMFTILKCLKKDFPIIPVRMKGVSLNDIKKSNLEVLQADEYIIASYKKIDSVISSIDSKLDNLKYSDETEPLYHHHHRIALRLMHIDPRVLRTTINEIGNQNNIFIFK